MASPRVREGADGRAAQLELPDTGGVSWVEGEIAARGGAVSFRDYMELVLYHPEQGYYTAGPTPFGRGGDFLTAPTASPWYAAVLGRWLRSLAGGLGPLTLVDAGSGDGSLLAGVLGIEPGGTVARAVSVEGSPNLRVRQAERLAGAPVPVEVVADLAEATSPVGPVVLHACELFDALPVHRVVGRGGVIRELWVTAGAGSLGWEERPVVTPVVEYFARHGVRLVEGQLAEANLAAGPLLERLLGWSGVLGVALVLDYGYPARRLYDPRGRRGGSLACYRGHELGRDPLAFPGEQDVTAHVNWDDLRAAAAAAGWQEVGLWGLGELLLRAGIGAELEARGVGESAELDADVYAQRQEVKRLLDPEGMGSDLKALVLATRAVVGVVAESLALGR